MGRRKMTAKTGGNKIKPKRNETRLDAVAAGLSSDDFHRERDESFLALEKRSNTGDSEDDNFEFRQSILDLGVGDESSNGENDKDEDSGSEQERDDHDDRGLSTDNAQKMELSTDDENSDDDDENEGVEGWNNSVRNWGKRKSAYYSGDTGDLELGQSEDDAFVEEAAAREVQTAQFVDMDGSDFELPVDHSVGGDNRAKAVAGRGKSKLGLKERRRVLKLRNPEVVPIAAYVSDVSKEFVTSTDVATRALLEDKATTKSVGASVEGQLFLLTKSMIEQSTLLNAAMYLFVNCSLADEGAEDGFRVIDFHPVMQQLKRVSAIRDKFDISVEDVAENLRDQVRDLVKATSLLVMPSTTGMLEAGSRQTHGDGENPACRDPRVTEEIMTAANVQLPATEENQPLSFVADEARYGLRQHEIEMKNIPKSRRTPRFSDTGDSNEGETPRGFVAAIHSIDQRAAKKGQKRQPSHNAEHLDQIDDGDVEVAHGIRMMEEELEGRGDRSLKEQLVEEEKQDNDEDRPLDGMSFYNDIAGSTKRKKEAKEKLYTTEKKFPTLEAEVEGERAISRTIMKNRGLVPHKAKINRNPRSKKREQYRKALIKRKGAVREVRTQGHRYEGEETGIKSRVSRSRKLAS